jgi:ribose 1,5-bisphosphokinase PhnN
VTQDREFVRTAADRRTTARAIAASDEYQELPPTSSADFPPRAEQDAFTTGWDAAVLAVFAEVDALLAPEAFLTSAGVSTVVRNQLAGIRRRFEVAE